MTAFVLLRDTRLALLVGGTYQNVTTLALSLSNQQEITDKTIPANENL